MFLYFIKICSIFNLLLLINVCQPLDIGAYCPRMLHQVFDGFAPVGNTTAGNYTEYAISIRLRPCVDGCCKLGNYCNVAFIYNNTCYHVQCNSNELCLPMKRPNITMKLQMVLVNPVAEDSSWIDVLQKSNLGDIFISNPQADQTILDKYDLTDNVYGFPYADKNSISSEANFGDIYTGFGRFPTDQYTDENDLQMEESKLYSIMPCEVGVALCPVNEECIQLIAKSRQGFCNCASDYIRNKHGKCIKTNFNRDKIAESLMLKQLNDDDIIIADPKQEITETTIKKLTVSVVSKNVRLPEKEVTLAAYTIPDEKSTNDTYKYLWSLISQPSGNVNGTMSDQTKDNVILSNLSEGLYRFKVVVTGNNLYGEAYANVTVLPEKRINKAPIVIITPTQQTVKLPTSKAILDGSTSKDDDKIISWHWDLIQGPLGYQPTLPETSTLQLGDLTSPGNYTFKLTVTDSDNTHNSTTACITVLKANDYPPEANAGPDVIVYLPHNNVTLNGSLSTDDREIIAWEWTKDSNDESKAVDMQHTRTPYLQLSNLEEGIYTFVLKVTDASNQSSSAKVHVFVKPPTNLPPVANAGLNFTINLPQTWALLNASLSTDDVKISNYEWRQLSGPSGSNILHANSSIANATSLTIGSYVFVLNIIDENKNNASDRVLVTVVQEKNTPPVANAGGDQTITLPCNTLYINGSKSYDDLGVVRYQWTRDGISLATGTIIGNSSSEPLLIVTNIVPGRYVFILTVSDAQGLTDSDTVSIIVHPDPMMLNMIELTLTVGISVLTQSEIESLEQKLMLLLGDNTNLRVRDLKMEQKTGEAVLVFYVEKSTSDSQTVIMSGLEAEKLLTDKFWRDSAILGTLISDVRTTICQNTCSGHGVCNSETRACMCETFWMPDIFYFWGIRQANCDWSILYVVVVVFLGFLCISGCCWGITCLCRRTRKPRSRNKPQKYALLGAHDDEIPSLTRGTSLSDSDTDSDVLFESRSKQNGILRSNGSLKNGQLKYSVTRLGRRIKT